MLRELVGATVVLMMAGEACAKTHSVKDAAGFNQAVAQAKPGDTILLAPGKYVSNFFFRDVHGTEKEPITIDAADKNDLPQLAGKSAPLHFSNASHLILKNLIIANLEGNGLNIDDGGNAEQPTHHLHLQNIQVQGISPKGNLDGMKLSGVEDFVIEQCEVTRWGTDGSAIDMVGCHRGRIVDCSFQNGGASGVQAKGGSAEVTIRRCTFKNAGQRALNLGGSTGDDYFRPRLDTFPKNEKCEARNLCVEGCLIEGSSAAIAFVGVDGAVVRYNTIYHPERYAIRILQEKNDAGFVPCRGGRLERNLIVFTQDHWASGGVNIGGNTAPETFHFASNFWFCEDRPDRSKPQLPTPENDGIYGQDPLFKNPSAGDFGTSNNSPAREYGPHALPAS